MGTRASLSFRYIAPPHARRKGHIRLAKLAIHLLPRPDSSELHHPPPSLANCGPAETGDIFRAVGGVLQGSGVTRDALKGLKRPHFRYWSLISIFECHVCAK